MNEKKKERKKENKKNKAKKKENHGKINRNQTESQCQSYAFITLSQTTVCSG